MDRWQITNATLVFPDRAENGGLLIDGNRIQKILTGGEQLADVLEVDLHGLFLYPGLINSHDTLLASYSPLAAPARPYSSWLAYDNALKSSVLFRERMLIDTADLYLLGAYRNLLAGTTTVVDHIPEFVRRPFAGKLPVHLLEDFGIAHAVDHSSLGWGQGVQIEHEKAVRENRPFLLHIAEGTDREARESLATLQALGALSEHTVLLSGVGLSGEDLERIAKAGAHLVFCPVASQRLFGQMPDVARALELGISVSLGTDAAMTGSLNLLEELRAARKSLPALGAKDLYAMVTSSPARALRLPCGELKAGGRADLLVLQGKGDPYLNLCEASTANIFLVVADGRPVFGDKNTASLADSAAVEKIEINGREKWITGSPQELLTRIEMATGKRPELPFLNLRTLEKIS